ncbi:MAG TPA: Na+:solute symporter [Candidatus Enterocloster faecavium]|uniref:Na+:solute symporter n=1 Tax=Candidatus Enterocloster faecavium TaxID=2838560 RepID=A0A9D2RLU0_9FIRM|nr:Na+:solute symporter [Candidatus Enterocloster faecavium]
MNIGYMEPIDYVTLSLFFLIIIGIGIWSKRTVQSSEDFYVGGGKVPWWLSGISHHVSGYSGVVFVGYAGIAYAQGTAIYFWWAINIALAMSISAVTIVPRWPRLRQALGIESPTEYLRVRYNTPTQMLVAISGIVVKLLDVGAKWASLGILLYGFTGLPIWLGIILGSMASMIYVSIGGIMADLLTDFVQFMVTLLAGLFLFFSVLMHLGDYGLTLGTVAQALPEGHLTIFNAGRGQGSVSWTLLYFFVIFFSYSGGTWNLAARFISTSDDKQAKKAAFLSSALYVIWPLILFFPMWCGPIIFPGLTQAEAEASLYASLAGKFLPVGLVGLVLAAMFAQTMSMCNSDVNTISAVITRDVLPKFFPAIETLEGKKSLYVARLTTVLFTACTVIVGLMNEQFGGVTGMILSWFAALLGPTAIPLLLGLLPIFKHCDSKAAIASILAGLGVFVATKMGLKLETDIELIAPLFTSFVVFAAVGLVNQYVLKKEVPSDVEQLMNKLGSK